MGDELKQGQSTLPNPHPGRVHRAMKGKKSGHLMKYLVLENKCSYIFVSSCFYQSEKWSHCKKTTKTILVFLIKQQMSIRNPGNDLSAARIEGKNSNFQSSSKQRDRQSQVRNRRWAGFTGEQWNRQGSYSQSETHVERCSVRTNNDLVSESFKVWNLNAGAE